MKEQQEKVVRHFICPDGDLHIIAPVNYIWIDYTKNFLSKTWRVHVECVNGLESFWERKTEDEAKLVRSELIKILGNL